MLSLFSGGIIISSTRSFFTILSSFDLVPASAILFPNNSPVLGANFLETAFKESGPVFNNYFLYFLPNDKNPYPLTYFLVLGSIEYRMISIY